MNKMKNVKFRNKISFKLFDNKKFNEFFQIFFFFFFKSYDEFESPPDNFN